MKLSFILDLFFPPLCLSCRTGPIRGTICGSCLSKITIRDSLLCGKCGARLPNGAKECHKNYPCILGAAADYDSNEIKALVRGLKFERVRNAAIPLAALLYYYVAQLDIDQAGFIVVPVPLSTKRLRERGFNQSELIARPFAEKFGIPLVIKALVRTKHAKPQSETKNLRERTQNIRGCFAVKNTGLVAGKKILLIDDVTTSGATFLEAAIALKIAGAGKIIALAVARA